MSELRVQGVAGTRPVLPHSEASLRQALDAAGLGTFLWHVQADRFAPDGRMLALFGFADRRTFSLSDILDTLIHAEDRARLADAFSKAIEPGGTGVLREEVRVQHADGLLRWLSIIGRTAFEDVADSKAAATDRRIQRALQMSGIAADITERKQREAKLAILERIAADCDSHPHDWREEDVETRQSVVERLFPRLEQALAEQAGADNFRDTQLLHDLSVRSVSDSDIQTFFDAIVTAAVSIAGAQAGCLQLLDTETSELVLLSAHGFDPALEPHFRRVTAASPTSCGKALASGGPAVVHVDEHDASDTSGSLRMLFDAGVRSAQSTPLVTRAGRTIGILSTHWSKPNRQLSERERRFIDMLARQAAEMLDRRRVDAALRESERRLSEELADTRLLQLLSAQLIEGHGSESLYEAIVDAASSIMRSEYATMQMFHPERGPRGALRLVASRGFTDEAKDAWKWVRAEAATTCALALRTGGQFVAEDIATCEPMVGTEDQERLLEAGIHAAQSTPLVSRGGKTLGMITTHWTAARRPSEREFRLLDILVRQAADLMERAQAEDALRRSESRLKEADRRKDVFLATLAHELRNPLASLRTSLELIRIAGDSREPVEDARVTMEEQVTLLVRLVDDLLDVSRITSGKVRLQRRPAPLAHLLAMAVQANRGVLEAAKLALHIDAIDNALVIDADALRFVQVVSNVLNNAIKFTDPGGHISIAARLTPPSGADAKEVALVISDSGVGISPDMLPRLFDLFSQGDDETAARSHTGLGIGLALARRLIELHGGSIEAHSDGVGRGSTFTLRMPLSHRIADARPVASTPTIPRISRRVVVIDDNLSAARAMHRLVTALGGECQIAHDGETGLAHIRQLRPDLVILDIGMPGLDGYETCGRIRQEFGPELIIVALTGWGQQRDKQRALRAGFNIHLTKPADPLILEELLAGQRDALEFGSPSD